MVTFGRPSGKRPGTPNNKNMATRANTQLEAIAVSKAAQYTTALGVDAPFFYFWHKDNGSIPCSCVAEDYGPNRDVEPGGETKTNTTATSKPEYRFVDTEFGKESLDDLFGAPMSSRQANIKQKLEIDVYNDPSMSYDELSDEIDDIQVPDGGITNFEDPLNLFSDKTIACPICLGSGFIDSWNIHGGKRYVFDTSNVFDFYCEGIDIQSEYQPTTMSTQRDAKAFWSFRLPRVWDKILRIDIYNGVDRLQPHQYKWTWFTNGTSDIMSAKSLENLNGTSSMLKMSIELEKDLKFTHAEIVFAFTDPYRAQIPELSQGYEAEFLDWSVNLSVELPPELKIAEGDYLTESKYRKVWKISVLTRKITAGGVVYGLSADLRALHSFERNYIQMGLFSDSYNPTRLLR